MDFLPELLKQGLLGLFGGVAFWLYLTEKKDHDKTRGELMTAMLARLDDSKENMTSITTTAQGMSQSVQLLSEKIELAKGRR